MNESQCNQYGVWFKQQCQNAWSFTSKPELDKLVEEARAKDRKITQCCVMFPGAAFLFVCLFVAHAVLEFCSNMSLILIRMILMLPLCSPWKYPKCKWVSTEMPHLADTPLLVHRLCLQEHPFLWEHAQAFFPWSHFCPLWNVSKLSASRCSCNKSVIENHSSYNCSLYPLNAKNLLQWMPCPLKVPCATAVIHPLGNSLLQKHNIAFYTFPFYLGTGKQQVLGK